MHPMLSHIKQRARETKGHTDTQADRDRALHVISKEQGSRFAEKCASGVNDQATAEEQLHVIRYIRALPHPV